MDLDLAQIHLGFQGSKSMDLKSPHKPKNLEIHRLTHSVSLWALRVSLPSCNSQALLPILSQQLQKNAKVGAYKNIIIDNWEDIEILCGRDRATSIGVEHREDAVEVTTEKGENEERMGSKSNWVNVNGICWI
ncbi:uncharacterized protein LOC126709988 isoform X2 [Quercus robur]|uniref:uncharacterized protein LOC126709988 isoform X2 n=1 Tax=Quercus robur TaxID=38942 RepID=UPI0021632453|nr:uncharacterized protein LOC126709988 isoform X2 [Quercus robur]